MNLARHISHDPILLVVKEVSVMFMRLMRPVFLVLVAGLGFIAGLATGNRWDALDRIQCHEALDRSRNELVTLRARLRDEQEMVRALQGSLDIHIPELRALQKARRIAIQEP